MIIRNCMLSALLKNSWVVYLILIVLRNDGHYLSVQLHNLRMATRIIGWYGPILLILRHWHGNDPIHISAVLYFYLLLFGHMHFCGCE
jgi:hypothetical protein